MSIVAIFTSLTIASDFALAPVLNVKLMDTLVFSSTYAFGFKIGAYIAVLSELIWSFVSPFGNASLIAPFLIAGELIYVVAGYFCSKVWRKDEISILSYRNLFLGAVLAICAFLWDFETNLATGLLVLWPNHVTLLGVLAFEVVGIPFMIPHELGDFVLGSLLAPIIIAYFLKSSGRERSTERIVTTLESR